MRYALLAAISLVAACGQPEPPPPLPEPPAVTAPAPWFICDALNAPVLLVFERDGTTARVAQYDKPNGALVRRTEYQIGAEEGGMSSTFTTLMQNGAEAGAVRRLSADVLETPGAAYTPFYSSVRIGERDLSCRWMPRTRLIGFTGRRTIVISEDVDGDLLYHSYDFATAAEAQPVELSENGRTTTFSLEVRDGAEMTTREFTRYGFRADAETETEISVITEFSSTGRVEVRRNGPTPQQSEDLIAYVVGAGVE